MILRLERDTFKVLSTNARDVSEDYIIEKDGTEFFLFTLEMAVDNGLFCTGHIYNQKTGRFDCIDLPVEFLHLKEFGEDFLIGRKVLYIEPLSEGLKPKRIFDLIFTVREEFGIPSDVEFQVCF